MSTSNPTCSIEVTINGQAGRYEVEPRQHLVDFLRNVEEVATFKWPERLIIVDSLPRNPLGKVLKRELRQTHFPDPVVASGRASA